MPCIVRHKKWKHYVHNRYQYTLVKSLHLQGASASAFEPNLERVLESSLVPHYQQLISVNQQLQPILPVNRHSRFKLRLRWYLALIFLLLLPYSTTIQALSATTVNVINGSQPYFTFDNGVTKITTTDGLLGITLSNGTRITPSTNTSTDTNPIKLPRDGESFADIGMLIPPTTTQIFLNNLIDTPYYYWGDDDGDGQGSRGVRASGYMTITITDRLNQAVSRSTILDICQAPYKVVLTCSDGNLITRYGLPNSSDFKASNVTYYINPNAEPKICYARPNMQVGAYAQEITGWKVAGPANIWSLTYGFLTQSTESSSYYRNFPTTGANNLHFDLLVGGINGLKLTWPDVSNGGITATITPNPPISAPFMDYPTFNADGASTVRVTLKGPEATEAQMNSDSPGNIGIPTLPQSFELVGYDESNRKIVKYGFVIKQWFVNRGKKTNTIANHASWCASLGSGYRLPKIKDLTNAVDKKATFSRWRNATPPSIDNYYQRNIGAGFFTEWGNLLRYTDTSYENYNYGTSNYNYDDYFTVTMGVGIVVNNAYREGTIGICTYP